MGLWAQMKCRIAHCIFTYLFLAAWVVMKWCCKLSLIKPDLRENAPEIATLTETSVSQLVMSPCLNSYLVYKTLFCAQIIFHFLVWKLLKESVKVHFRQNNVKTLLFPLGGLHGILLTTLLRYSLVLLIDSNRPFHLYHDWLRFLKIQECCAYFFCLKAIS